MRDKLCKVARDAGCAGCGITTATEFAGVAATLRERAATGLAGRRRFTYKDPYRAADVRRSFPWARSVVALSWPYLPGAGSPGRGGLTSGRVARFATGDRYEGLRAAAAAVAESLSAGGYRAEVLVDDDRLVDRAAAVRAGIAWWGKSTMVLDPKHGPWLLLGSVVTDADLGSDRPMRRDCGTCDACIPACPTGAIVAPGVLDASRCLAHWLQTAGVFPVELRSALGDRVYGCDDCLDACPPGHKELGGVRSVQGRIDLLEILGADDAALLDRYRHFYLPGRRPRILRRNAIIALGNSWYGQGNAATGVLTALAECLNSTEEILRIHAAWALAQVGGNEARRHLESRREEEAVPAVVDEIDTLLEGYASSKRNHDR